jgi:hypothetical protein
MPVSESVTQSKTPKGKPKIKENTVENPTIARVSKVASLTSVKIIE